MGLSASQARLLSITQRLNHNELQSEVLSMQKMRLADRNTVACRNYVNALDATKLDYISYNETGIQEAVGFSFNAMNQYSPLKNQYALFNNEDQIYVNSTDAENFQKSESMYDFLAEYGIFDVSSAEYKENKQKYDEEKAKYDADKKIYDEGLSKYQSELDDYSKKLNEYNEKLAEYERKKKEYEEALNTPDLYKIFSDAVGTSEELLAIPSTSYDLPSGLPNSKGCYWSALHPDGTYNRASCYTHVLGHIIDYTCEDDHGGLFGPYTTTAGDEVNCAYAGGYMDDTCNPEMEEVSNGINEKDADGNYKRICDGTDDYRGITGITNALEKALQDFADGTIDATELKMWRLISDFVENPDGTFSKKSLKQKAIDLMYLSQNWAYADNQTAEFSHSILTDDMMVDILINFTDGDLKNLTLDPPEEVPPFDEEMPTFSGIPPQEPVEPEQLDKIYDKPLAQWYVNLWYLMDGSKISDEIYTIYDEEANFDYFTVPNTSKTSTEQNNHYVIMDEQNASDTQWLQFAINNSWVTLSQAGLRNEIGGSRITWQGIEFSSTSDIREVQDETKIARAEAEYNQAMIQIQAEDKQLDLKIKKLDTEHSACQKELDSVKNVMSKNIEKSFTAFS